MPAILFFNDAAWLAHEPCFDYRGEGQILPSGSVVCGIISEDATQEVLFPPSLTAGQEQQWESLLAALRAGETWDGSRVLAQTARGLSLTYSPARDYNLVQTSEEGAVVEWGVVVHPEDASALQDELVGVGPTPTLDRYRLPPPTKIVEVR